MGVLALTVALTEAGVGCTPASGVCPLGMEPPRDFAGDS